MSPLHVPVIFATLLFFNTNSDLESQFSLIINAHLGLPASVEASTDECGVASKGLSPVFKLQGQSSKKMSVIIDLM